MSLDAAGIRLALCGDVMLGRGVDQILPYPGDPTLYSLMRTTPTTMSNWPSASTGRYRPFAGSTTSGVTRSPSSMPSRPI